MKCIPLLTKLVIFLLLLSLLTACASKSSKFKAKPRATASSNTAIFGSSQKNTRVADVEKEKYKKALAHLQSGELLRAEKLLKEVSSKYPRMAGPYINLGIIAMKEGRWQEAENLFISAKTLSPNNSEVYNYLGVVYRQQGKFNEAKDVYLLAIERDKAFSSAYLNLGILYDLYLSDYGMAKKYYQKYQALQPDDENIKSWLIDLDQRIQASNG